MDCENNDAEFDDWAMNKYLKENDPERVISFKTIGFYILFLIVTAVGMWLASHAPLDF